jgi:NTE family protein
MNLMERETEETYVISVPFSKHAIKEVTGGVIKGHNIDNMFSELTLGYHDSIDFKKLPIPYASVSENLVVGEEYIFQHGVLSTAMRASMAIPGVFTPVRLNDMVLIDGGVVNNYPVDVARKMGAEIIIGIDVQNELRPADELNNAGSILTQLVYLMGQDKYMENLNHTNVHIKVNVKGYSAASFTHAAVDTLISRGTQAAELQREALLKLKEDIGVAADYQPTVRPKYQPLKQLYIQNIIFNGLEDSDKDWIVKRCKLKENAYTTIEQIEKATSIIRANTNYSSVTYKLIHNADGHYDLNYLLNKKQESRINIGVRFDSEEIASLLVNVRTTLKRKAPSYVSATARLGKQYGCKLAYAFEPSPLSAFGLSYRFMSHDIDYYQQGKRSFNSTFRHHTAEFSYKNVWVKNVQFDMGLRYELYNYEKLLFQDVTSTFNLENEHFFTYFANMHFDTYDKAYFPSRGVKFNGTYTFYTDDFLEYKGRTPFSAVLGSFEGVIPVTRRFSIIPSINGRILIGRNIPYTKMNVMGGDVVEQHLPYQLPFVGIDRVELMKNSLFIGGVKLRQRMGNIHYLTLAGNYALSSNKIQNIMREDKLFGCAITYGVDSMFGPLEATFNYTSHSDKVGFYINLGYKF